MSALTEGDIIVLVSGSPRMCVETISGKNISCVWINEGIVHRDTFNAVLLRKWEVGKSDSRDKKSYGKDRNGGHPYKKSNYSKSAKTFKYGERSKDKTHFRRK